MDIVELGVGTAVIGAGAVLVFFIKKTKNKMKRCVLRNN